jgi:hypothetical protein
LREGKIKRLKGDTFLYFFWCPNKEFESQEDTGRLASAVAESCAGYYILIYP